MAFTMLPLELLQIIFSILVCMESYETARHFAWFILRKTTRLERKNVGNSLASKLLLATAQRGCHQTFSRIISHGVSPDDAVLMIACKRGHLEIVEALVNMRHLDLKKALVLAAACNHLSIVTALMLNNVFDRRAFAASAWNGHAGVFWWIHKQRAMWWMMLYDGKFTDETNFEVESAGFHTSAIEIAVLAGRSDLVRRARTQFPVPHTVRKGFQSFGWLWLPHEDGDIRNFAGEGDDTGLWEPDIVEDASIYDIVARDDFDAIPDGIADAAKIEEYIMRNGEVGKLLKMLREEDCSHV
jgi:Ankyrin repeats (3 copies)